MVCCSTTARSGFPGVRLRGVGDVVESEQAANNTAVPTTAAVDRNNLVIGTRMKYSGLGERWDKRVRIFEV
jgi:hypothetical protein